MKKSRMVESSEIVWYRGSAWKIMLFKAERDHAPVRKKLCSWKENDIECQRHWCVKNSRNKSTVNLRDSAWKNHSIYRTVKSRSSARKIHAPKRKVKSRTNVWKNHALRTIETPRRWLVREKLRIWKENKITHQCEEKSHSIQDIEIAHQRIKTSNTVENSEIAHQFAKN